MNLKELKRALTILKSQKLIKYYDTEIEYWNNDKLYRAYFENYNWFSHCVCFWYNRNKNNHTDTIKNLIYENYIKQ